jgi:hypothetical protein
MSATVAASSQGSQLKVSISSGFTAINQLQNLVGPSIVTDYNEITTLSSPSAFKEYLPIMKDPGPVTFDLVWNPADAAQIYLQQANFTGSATPELFQEITTHAVPKTIAYSAYVSKFEISASTGKVWMAKVELKVTGLVTIS